MKHAGRYLGGIPSSHIFATLPFVIVALPMCLDESTADRRTPIRLTIWSEADPVSVVQAVQADIAKRSIPVDVQAKRFISFQHISLDHHVYAVIRPSAQGPGVHAATVTVDAIGDLMKERFRPKQDGTPTTVFIFGPDGAMVRCLEVKKNSEKDVTKAWGKRRPQFSFAFADDEGYVSCLQCSARGLIGGFVRKRRQCPRCIGTGRHMKADATPS